MLATWLIELYLNDLGCLSDEGDKLGHAKLQKQFQSFLRSSTLRECLEINKKTVYGLISSHGAVEDLVFFATLMKGTTLLYCVVCTLTPVADYEKVMMHCLQQYRYADALGVLREQAETILGLKDSERRARLEQLTQLVYKFSPALMKQCPADTVDTWIKIGRYLDAKRLIPALVQCTQPPDPTQVQECPLTVYNCILHAL